MTEETSLPRRGAWVPRVWLVMRFCIAGLAIFALRRELTQLDFATVGRQITELGWGAFFAALMFTVVSFLLLGIFEILALRYAARHAGTVAADCWNCKSRPRRNRCF